MNDEILQDIWRWSSFVSKDEKIRAAIKVECDRQHVGEDRQEMLYKAYQFLMMFGSQVTFDEKYIKHVASMIEPDNGGKFRTTLVSFNGIVGGVSPQSIPGCMSGWIAHFNEEFAMSRGDQNFAEVVTDPVIKEFLDIHPFSDGNGRTAWLLRVWMLDQWDDPQPLPDYYG